MDRSIEKLPGCERLQCYSKFFLLNFSVYLYNFVDGVSWTLCQVQEKPVTVTQLSCMLLVILREP